LAHPRISVVIVNYNVEHFLNLCLESVFKALEGIEAEVFVVDNHSSDGSAALVKSRYPSVFLIENQENVGFSRANNQAILKAKGEFVLLLNPDTVLAEDTFSNCLSLMDQHTDVGCIGARMLDGSGTFLPESKRGLPTPWVSFCKAFGLSALFPKSRLFGRYHLSYISENEKTEVDVLSGAFMFIRKCTLDKAGLLDESFFMYGEDVDLSYRLQKTGFRNMYCPDITILHFKGESTKRGSISFVKHFYKAMLLFSKKHFSQNLFFTAFIFGGIGLRAIVALINRFWAFAGVAMLEFAFAFVGMYFLKNWWELNFKGLPGMYPDFFIQLLIPVYLLVWIGSTRFISRYSAAYGQQSIIRGIVLGTILISGITNFFDDYRFSKGLILIGAVWTYVIVSSSYFFQFYLNRRQGKIRIQRSLRWLLVGNYSEFHRIKSVFSSSNYANILVGWVGNLGIEKKDTHYLGTLTSVTKLCYRLGIDSLIFSFSEISVKETLQKMPELKSPGLQFSFLARNSDFLLSSTEKHRKGMVFQAESIPDLLKPNHLRLKRLTDLVICLLLLFLLPLCLFKTKSKAGFFRNFFQVLKGKKSWVGLSVNAFQSYGLKDSIITMANLAGPEAESSWVLHLDELYLREFVAEMEIWTVIKNLDKI
jgi:GT2 family glycosyltransferase